MTDEQLIVECKVGLNISPTVTAVDNVLKQKLQVVKGYMKGAGVSDAMMNDAQAVGVIVMGVADLWNIKSGEIKFSPVFHTLATQLAVRSLPAEGSA